MHTSQFEQAARVKERSGAAQRAGAVMRSLASRQRDAAWMPHTSGGHSLPFKEKPRQSDEAEGQQHEAREIAMRFTQPTSEAVVREERRASLMQ